MSTVTIWPICPRPYPDELLSSFLVRVAHANGASPWRFYSFHLSGPSIWTRDIDRNAELSLLTEVSRLAQVDLSILHGMTMQSWEDAMTDGRRSGRAQSIAPCINVVGSSRKMRKHFGMQYCAECLREEPYFRKAWRLSFVTTCTRHQADLRDCCVTCGASIAFCASEISLLHCFKCGRSLTLAKRECRPGHQVRAALQSKLFNALLTGTAMIGGREVSAAQLVRGVLILLRVLLVNRRSKAQCALSEMSLFKCPGSQIEKTRLGGRAIQCIVMASLLLAWPLRFAELASQLHLTQRSFAPFRELPLWLEDFVQTMPVGIKRQHVAHRSLVRAEFQRIRRRKKVGWRNERAKVILKALKK